MSQTGITLKLGPNSNDIEVIQIIIITGPVILLGSMMYVGSRSLIHQAVHLPVGNNRFLFSNISQTDIQGRIKKKITLPQVL